MTSTKYYNSITILKSFAVLFITWFHFKWSVPESLSPIFIGGSIGNSIFFFCSGYLLSFKREKYKGQWLLQKYLRIIPSVWVTLGIMTICSCFRPGISFGISFIEWFWPNQFWFVKAILIYYFISYVSFDLFSIFHIDERKISKSWVLTMMAFAFIAHILYYFFCVNKEIITMDDSGVHCWFYWYIFFLLGCYMKMLGTQISCGKLSIFESLLSIVLFFGYKVLAQRFVVLSYVQFITIPLLLFYIVYSLRKLSYYILSINLPNSIKNSLVFLSEITLEVYLVQYYFIKWLMPLIPFPINIGICLVVILIMAYITHIVASRISSLRFHI